MKVYLSIGSNLDDREENLKNAINSISRSAGALVAVSSVYETEPVGFESPDLFLNMVIAIKTDLPPVNLLDKIRHIEVELGRTREEGRYISRTIDIDILFYEDQIIESSGLIIPHPRMYERRFVLEPFCDIAPEFIHPVLQISIKDLFDGLKDESMVTRLK